MKHYEENSPHGIDSYWNMGAKECVGKELSTDYTKEIYKAMEKHFGQNQCTNPTDMIIDTSASDHRTFGESHVPAKSLHVHEDASLKLQLESPSDSFPDRDN